MSASFTTSLSKPVPQQMQEAQQQTKPNTITEKGNSEKTEAKERKDTDSKTDSDSDTDTDTGADTDSEEGERNGERDGEKDDESGERNNEKTEEKDKELQNLPLFRLQTSLLAQTAAVERIRASDPLVVVLDAAVDKANTESAKEAFSRLMHCLSAPSVARRVTVLCAGTSDLLVLHPSEPHVFPFLDAHTNTMHASVGTLLSAINQPVVAKNIAFMAKTYNEAMALSSTAASSSPSAPSFSAPSAPLDFPASPLLLEPSAAAPSAALLSNAVPSPPRLRPALRLAAHVLSHISNRSDHAQVLIMWPGPRDADFAAGGVSTLVPAFAALDCSVGISCVALGPEAPLDSLGAITTVFDGLLTYSDDVSDAGSALVAAMRFLAKRPSTLLAPTEYSVLHSSTPSARVLLAQGVLEARMALAQTRTFQLFGVPKEERAEWEWAGCCSAGAFVTAPNAAQFFEHGFDESVCDTDARKQMLRLYERASSAAANLSFLLASLSPSFSPSCSPSFSPSLPLSPSLSSTLRVLRSSFVHALADAVHPFFDNVGVLEDQRDALDALECDTSVLAARAELVREQPRWIEAEEQRAARYLCAKSGARTDVLCVVCNSEENSEENFGANAKIKEDAKNENATDANADAVLWAPFCAPGFNVWNCSPEDAEKPLPIRVGPRISFLPAAPLVGARSKVRSTEIEKETEDDGVDGEDNVEFFDTEHKELLLPLFLRPQDVSNAYVSVEASKAMAALARTSVWRDPLLCARIHGGLVGRWLLFAAGGAELPVRGDIEPLPPPSDPQLVADVCRTLAIAAEAHLVADMFARFVRGKPAPNELAKAQEANDKEANDKEKENKENKENKSSGLGDGVEGDGVKAGLGKGSRALQLLESGKAWRSSAVCSALPVLGATLMLWRNSTEHERARSAALKEAVEAELQRRKRVARALAEQSVEEQITAEKLRRKTSALPRLKPDQEKALRRKLNKNSAQAQAGAALDDDTTREEICAKIVQVPVDAHVKPHLFRITEADATAVCSAISETAEERGWSEAVRTSLTRKLQELYAIGDALVFSVPADAKTLVAIAAIFNIACV